VEPLLTFAAELEQRDADVAQSLEAVEALQSEVDDVRRDADAASSFFASLRERRTEHADAERAALAARAEAETSLRVVEEQLAHARKEDERLEAERARQDAADAVSAAERWLEQVRAAAAADAAEAERWSRVEDEVAARARELTPRIPDQPAPSHGLGATIEWASQARGALLLEHSSLVRERDAIIREANELAASVLGEPLASGAVAGLRDRLARDTAQ